MPELILNGSSTYRVITDQLGSVRGVADASSGTVVQQIDYDAWGCRQWSRGPRSSPWATRAESPIP